ncbi:MAG: glycosyltransferase family 2 protein [Deltaproteobacteria bacterium]|nr:glycosyltransferase family 2 protein [Deltaproteobacteria bacterium]
MNDNRKPKFSVCIPTYGRAKVLPKVVGSVLSQTFKDFELFISDDASPDNTREVVKSFNDPRIRYHRNDKNLGVLDNWNFVISNARGEYVFKLDDDDYIDPRYLERTAAILDKYPEAGSVYTGFCYAKDYDGAYIEKVVDDRLFTSDKIRGIDYVMAYLMRTSVPGLHPSSAVFRYSLAKDIGFYDKVKNDLMFSLALASKADVGYVHEPLFYYVQHESARASYAEGKMAQLYDFEPTRIIEDFFAIDFIKENPELMRAREGIIERERIVRSIMHLIMCRKNFKLGTYFDIASKMIKRDRKLLRSPLFAIAFTGLIFVPKGLVESASYMFKSRKFFSSLAGTLFGKGGGKKEQTSR